MSPITVTTPVIPPEVEAELIRLSKAIGDKQGAIAETEAEHAALVVENVKLSAVQNETENIASLPEPRALDHARVEDWHSANRKWAAHRERANAALPGLKADHSRRVASMHQAARRIVGLRFERLQLELEHARTEHLAVQIHLNTLAKVVRERHVAVLAAPQA